MLSARLFSALHSAIDRFSFSFFGKTVIRKTGNLSLCQIYTTRAPPLFPVPLRATRTFRNPPVPRMTFSTFRVCRNQRDDVRTLFLAKQLVGNSEISRRLDHRLHSVVCTPLDTLGSRENCVPLDTSMLTFEDKERCIGKPRTKGAFRKSPVSVLPGLSDLQYDLAGLVWCARKHALRLARLRKRQD